MYARKVKDKELTFTVSGMLWRRSLIMEDEETESHWSHLMGKAMAGDLKGAELEVIPSEMTDWKAWKSEYPGTDVLDMRRTTNRFVTEVQQRPKEYTLGIRFGGAVADFPYDVLKELEMVEATVGEEPVILTYDNTSATARIFSRMLQEKELSFELQEGVLRDQETASEWSRASGICLKGEFKGKRLDLLPGIPSFVRAWKTFYPKSRTYSPK